MRTKLFIILSFLTILLCACGAKESSTPILSSGLDPSIGGSLNGNADLTDVSTSSSTDTSDKDFNVTITIPSDFAGETTQDELDETCHTLGYKSITLNDDGSVTYVMTEEQHEQMVTEVKTQINSQVQEMVGSEDYPNITDITVNDTFTQYTITTKSTQLSLEESISVFGFYIYSGMYSVFSGEEIDNIHIDFVNADTGEIINSSDSSDMNN